MQQIGNITYFLPFFGLSYIIFLSTIFYCGKKKMHFKLQCISNLLLKQAL